MGLDMYLKKKTYVGANYEHNKVTGTIDLQKEGKQMPIRLNRVSEITEEVGYWRKANQIHSWFVQNVQGGKDDCEEYSVSKGQVKDLLALCMRVKNGSILKDGAVTNGYTLENGVEMPIVAEGKEIANPSLAESLLPAKKGFFFGGTDYDQYYMHDIDRTIEILTNVLAESDPEEKEFGYLEFDLIYQSSW